MRYSKHPFIHLLACCGVFIALWQTLGSCTDEAGGADTPMPGKNIPLTIEITAEGFAGEADASATTRHSESGNTTIFEKTDTIGLFAVRNIGTAKAAIIDGIDNIPLQYIPAADASSPSEWEPIDATNILYYYADVTYVAYYPYKKGITITPTQSAAAIRTSFTEMPELQPAADQSSQEAYIASDLMTATGQIEDTNDPARKRLLLTLTHSYSLLELNAIDLSSKNFVSIDGAFDYIQPVTAPSPDLAATNAVLNGIKMLKKDNGVFRAIVKPTAGEITIKGSYITSSLLIGCDGSLPAPGLEAGKVHKWTMTATLPDKSEPVKRALKPGDIVFQNNGKIEIYPGDGAVDTNGRIPNYTNSVGMVVTCDRARMTDAACKAKGWNHAYVIGKDYINLNRCVWGPVVDESVLENCETNTAIAKLNMNGYKDTEAILTERASKGDLSDYTLFSQLSDYRITHPVPTGVNRSPWFLPSIGQVFDLFANLSDRSPDTYTYHDKIWRTDNANEAAGIESTLNKNLAKMGSRFINHATMVACCTENTETFIWGFYLSGTISEIMLNQKHITTNLGWPFFAF